MLRRVSTPVRATAFALLAGLFTLSTTASSEAQGYTGQFSWTGIYGGVHGSYAWADQEYPGAKPYVPPPLPGAGSGPPRQELTGGMLGGQIGAQYHFNGGFVIGVEADYSKGNLSSTARDGNFIVQTAEIEWTGTLRGRLGLPMGNFMPFVTAGIIWAGASYTQSCPEAAGIDPNINTHCRRADMYNVTKSETHMGFVYGGGVEWAINRNFSIKAEGLWYKLDEEVYAMGAAPLSKTNEQIGNKPIEYDGMMFRIGGNYRFN
jgi:outer membrane immunogenic protein